jgi:hypothetical protein
MAAGYRDTRKNSPSGKRAPSRWESPIRVKKKKTFLTRGRPRKGSPLDVSDRETLMKIGQKKKKSDKIKPSHIRRHRGNPIKWYQKTGHRMWET